MLFIYKNSWFQLLRTLPVVFISKFCFKAGCKLVSLSSMVFPTVLVMSRRLEHLLRMRSTWLQPC